MHGVKAVVETAHQRRGGLDHAVLVHAGELGRQLVLVDTVVMVQASLRAPADVEGGMDVGGGPIHDLDQLVPIVDVRKIQLLNGSAGDDEAVEIGIADLVERAVEGIQMLGGHVFSLVAAGAQKFHLALQRRVGELAHDLRLGGDLGGHEVQDQHAQGTNVLVQRAELRHDKDILALQRLGCRQGVWYANGHGPPRGY